MLKKAQNRKRVVYTRQELIEVRNLYAKQLRDDRKLQRQYRTCPQCGKLEPLKTFKPAYKKYLDGQVVLHFRCNTCLYEWWPNRRLTLRRTSPNPASFLSCY